MQAVVRIWLLGGALCACHVSSTHTPDGGDDQQDAAGTGLTVTFSVQPQVPGSPKNGVQIDEAVFKMLSLRVTGDAASVSSPSEIDLAWRAEVAPDPVVFASAPTGLYSKVSLRIDGQLLDNSYWINGTAVLNGTTYPFHIYDRNYLDVALYKDEILAPGGSVTIGVLVELDHAINDIDWSMVDLDNGTLTLDTFDGYMPTFRANLIQSFVIKDPNG
jgi:hypothetical protein